jgi:hypothetical protein
MKKVICILTMPFVCIWVSVKQCTISGTMTDKNKGPTTGLNILVKGCQMVCSLTSAGSSH